MRRGFLLALVLAAAMPTEARAFCGFYVGGADAQLYNDATMVVLMRDGTKTVLSMQNDYQGPPEGFALVVPVPEVLGEDNVRTLPKTIFQRVDQLAAPRLVEYWEQDPCMQVRYRRSARGSGALRSRAPSAPRDGYDQETGVTVEAQFAVAEYDIVILSAEDSSGLETWLHREQYAMPEGAGAALAPYVQLGTKFFVAKVDPERVTFERGRAVLSPLRVHYDAETFALPIRLGLLNAHGKQDLLVHILAKNARYDVANYPNVTIPTNLVVTNATRRRFGDFYRGLFDRVSAANEGAVVTEYSWQATSCDPCPTTPLQSAELALLGGDVIDGMPIEDANAPQVRRRRPPSFGTSGGWTLTRLHHRYDADDLDHDLVFRRAPAIIGGRGMPNAQGELNEQVAQSIGPDPRGAPDQPGTRRPPVPETNQFQGRYVILHRWSRPIRCDNPQRGRWGGPPGRALPRPSTAPSPLRDPRPTRARPLNPVRFIRAPDRQYLGVTATPATDAELDYAADPPAPPPEPEGEPTVEEPTVEEPTVEATPETEPTLQPSPRAEAVTETTGGCASCAASGPEPLGALPFLVALVGLRRRR